MKVFLLGHRGMLGHLVAGYLAKLGHEVITSSERYTGSPRDPLIEAVRESGAKWVVNCLGRIKQKSSDPDEMYLTNAIFPLHLRARLTQEQQLIHASTDCVFSGKVGQYAPDAPIDAEDYYGLSKALGEAVAQPNRHFVLRTSIIGPEAGTARGLMAWCLKQHGEINGYMNHLWNGITTLEWAVLCHEIIQGGSAGCGGPIIQVGSWPPMSKCELLRMISMVWNHQVQIRPVEAPDRIDRSLQPSIVRKPLVEQLRELKQFQDELAYPA